MVKTYLNYQQEKLFSGSFLGHPLQTHLINSHSLGKIILSASHETLLITKAGTNAQMLRVFPENNQSSAEVTLIRPIRLSSEMESFWDEEKSDGEGLDDPYGLFQEEKPLHMKGRSTVFNAHKGTQR